MRAVGPICATWQLYLLNDMPMTHILHVCPKWMAYIYSIFGIFVSNIFMVITFEVYLAVGYVLACISTIVRSICTYRMRVV